MTARAGAPLETRFDNRIDRRFSDLKGRAALILYITAGHPDVATSIRLAPMVADGADVIEIGIPFSDPVADGPVIQASSQAALANGTRVVDCLNITRSVRTRTSTPIVLFTYYNLVLHQGLDRFAQDASEAGVDGVICVDLPPDEAGPLRTALTSRAVHLIPLVAPTSTDQRLELACSMAGGFVYCVSRAGVTGPQEAMNRGLPSLLQRVRQHTRLPRAVGFGVSSPEHARVVSELAEGVVIGSALVDLISRTPPHTVEASVQQFIGSIREAMDETKTETAES